MPRRFLCTYIYINTTFGNGTRQIPRPIQVYSRLQACLSKCRGNLVLGRVLSLRRFKILPVTYSIQIEEMPVVLLPDVLLLCLVVRHTIDLSIFQLEKNFKSHQLTERQNNVLKFSQGRMYGLIYLHILWRKTA